MKAVIQCGGRGMRLRPYTSILPKPLMPIGSRPVLELLLKWLRRNGIREVFITTGYLGNLIRSFCSDGQQWNIKINYTQEIEPLGTIGPLSLLRDQLNEPFLVLNGDILTDLNLNEFVKSHRLHGGQLTIASTVRHTKMEFGVLDETNGTVTGFREKPMLASCVSMGLYCMNPPIMDYVPSGVPFGFDDLVLQMLEQGTSVHTFRHDGLWLDIGRADDFLKAQDIAWDEQSPARPVEVAA
jgi:NDP-sugar pyrophosphorylase family protein